MRYSRFVASTLGIFGAALALFSATKRAYEQQSGHSKDTKDAGHSHPGNGAHDPNKQHHRLWFPPCFGVAAFNNVGGATPAGGADFGAVAWSQDGSSVAWGDNATADNDKERSALQRCFDFNAVALHPDIAPGDVWQQAVTRQNGRELTPAKDRLSLTVREEARNVARLQPSKKGDHITCEAFTLDGRVVVGSEAALTLYDSSGKLLCDFAGHSGKIRAVSVSPDGRYLASGSSDKTLAIWSLDIPAPEEGEEAEKTPPLLTLFVDTDRQWVAWTQEGYYASSPKGDHLLDFRANSPKKGLHYTAYQFRNRFYRPDVIGRLLEAGSVEEALRKANAEAPGHATPVVNHTEEPIQKLAPPAVEILGPADGSAVSQPQITVRARLSDPNRRKVTAVALLLNGHKLGSRDLATEDVAKPGEWTHSVALVPGENVITLIATNDAKVESLPADVRVTYASQTTDTEKPALYGLAIGVSQYERNQFSLRYAAKDATDVTAAYKAQEGKLFRQVTFKTLTDAAATRDNILEGLDWLSKQVTQHDWAVVFVSGHGIADSLQQYYFVPFDGDPAHLKRTGVVWSDFHTTLTDLPGKVFLVLDTCHSAGVTGERVRGGDAYADVLRDAGSEETGMITFASSMPREVSLEDDKWNNGAFTKALIEALQGKADLNHDGVVTLAEADNYVSERVKELTGGRQHPTTERPSSIRSALPLALLR